MRRIALITFAAACTEGGSRPDPEVIALENEGIACLHGDPLAFAVNRPIEVRVDWEGVCLSGSCTTDKVSTCTATVSGQTVTLGTHASVVIQVPSTVTETPCLR